MVSKRLEKTKSITIDGKSYLIRIQEIPFREGVELFCLIDNKELRIPDLGLGEHEAFRLMEVEIRKYNKSL
jgi:hypothetical protein